MTKPKRRKTGGKKKYPIAKKRVMITARVAPETKAKAVKNAKSEKLSLGRYLDKIIGK